MQSPSQRLFDADVQSAEFRSGTLKGYWGVVAQDLLPDELVWPQVVLWIGAAPRAVAPDRYYVALNVDGYRAAAPTGTFWDSETKTILDTARRPKGKANSRFAKVFPDRLEKRDEPSIIRMTVALRTVIPNGEPGNRTSSGRPITPSSTTWRKSAPC